MRRLLLAAMVLGLAACASHPVTITKTRPGQKLPPGNEQKVSPYAPAQEDPSTRGDYVAGGLYKPGVSDSTPDYVPDVDAIPEPIVTDEPRSKVGNRPVYSVLGKTYRVRDSAQGFVEQGIASYYGQKFHGRRTSNLEVYDMNAFTAAHKTLPLPSFARVTNLENGKSVVVRVNDRGPFHEGRVIDLSYAAAVKIGVHPRGSARVEVRALSPGEDTLLARGGLASASSAGSARGSLGSVEVSAIGHAAPAVAEELAPASAPMSSATAPRGGDAITLQVASFTGRDNAERALNRLIGAGIAEARLIDGQGNNGQPLWRLRIGPLAAALERDIASRVIGLGFASPQRVRD